MAALFQFLFFIFVLDGRKKIMVNIWFVLFMYRLNDTFLNIFLLSFILNELCLVLKSRFSVFIVSIEHFIDE